VSGAEGGGGGYTEMERWRYDESSMSDSIGKKIHKHSMEEANC
jgi:hypothetical protein